MECIFDEKYVTIYEIIDICLEQRTISTVESHNGQYKIGEILHAVELTMCYQFKVDVGGAIAVSRQVISNKINTSFKTITFS